MNVQSRAGVMTGTNPLSNQPINYSKAFVEQMKSPTLTVAEIDEWVKNFVG